MALRKKASRIAGGRHNESRPVRTSKRYGLTAGSASSLNQALRGVWISAHNSAVEGEVNQRADTAPTGDEMTKPDWTQALYSAAP